MPLPAAVLAATIAGGSSIIGSGINAGFQGSVNKKTRKWNEKMHNLQRQEALSDFAMQNSYNHPSAQMARLRESGLNPNLVYGEGAVANNAGGVRAAPVESWSPRPAQVDLGGAAAAGLSAYYDTQTRLPQIDNLRAQNDLIRAQTLATLKNAGYTDLKIKDLGFDLGLKSELRPQSVEAAQLHNKKLATDITASLTEIEIKKAFKQPTIDKILQEILSLKKDRLLKDAQINKTNAEIPKILSEINEIGARVQLLMKEGKLKDFDLRLKELRGKASDWPAYMKTANDILTDIIDLF